VFARVPVKEVVAVVRKDVIPDDDDSRGIFHDSVSVPAL
jgi:hypothetical protein